MIWNFFKKRLFQLDAEEVHDLVVGQLQTFGRLSPRLLAMLSGTSPIKTTQAIDFADKTIPHPVGLAAGFDKNALLVPFLPFLGFSHAEIGSVTLRPQGGNEKPRLFRGENALFNRMGFNNDGAEVIAKRLESYRFRIPQNFVLGVNLGINKEVKPEEAADAYKHTYSILEPYGDYFAINLSSPNTPGLRDLQTLPHIEKIFAALKSSAKSSKKVFLKLAPELDIETQKELYANAKRMGIDGFILTNTLKGERDAKVGGWSGAPLTEISRSALEFARAHTDLPLVSVGGIMSADEALARLKRGAKVVQIYTGWIFNGPRFPSEIAAACCRQRS